MALPGDYRTETKPKEASSRTERKQADRTLFRSGTRAFFAAWLPPGSQPSSTGTLSRRWFSLSCALFACYVLLDRSTLYLQMWHDISAWYPPTGLAFALFIGLGFGAFPPLLLAGFVTGLVNYHQSVGSAEFWLLNPVVPIIYLVAARQLKKRLPGNLRIHSMRDLFYLLGIAAVASFSAALLCVAILLWCGELPARDYWVAAFNWWVGDAVALCTVTPLLLEFVLPGIRRVIGAPATVDSARGTD